MGEGLRACRSSCLRDKREGTMDRTKRRGADELLRRLEDTLAGCGKTEGASAAREAIVDARTVLGDGTASYKASDYAVARVHAKLARLAGYRSLELSDDVRAAWRNFEDFVYGEARDDLRGVGGPNLG